MFFSDLPEELRREVVVRFDPDTCCLLSCHSKILNVCLVCKQWCDWLLMDHWEWLLSQVYPEVMLFREKFPHPPRIIFQSFNGAGKWKLPTIKSLRIIAPALPLDAILCIHLLGPLDQIICSNLSLVSEIQDGSRTLRLNVPLSNIQKTMLDDMLHHAYLSLIIPSVAKMQILSRLQIIEEPYGYLGRKFYDLRSSTMNDESLLHTGICVTTEGTSMDNTLLFSNGSRGGRSPFARKTDALWVLRAE